MEKRMINKVWNYMQKYQMLQKDNYVVTGVSGGADSVCLLLMLMELQSKIPFAIHVVHINHLIREEAGEDAAFVEALCKKLEIPFTLVEKDVEKLAKEEHISTEEAGRRVRYEAFEEVLCQYASGQTGKIAVAHNQSDCAETFLWNLFRGSGVKGLVGISPVRDRIIRPLLCLTRTEIEAYLTEKNVSFCIDCTNLENNYTRNKIRNQLIPFVEEEICRQSASHIAETCQKMQEINGLIQDMTQAAMEKCVFSDESGTHLISSEWEQIHPTIRSYVMMDFLALAAGKRKDLETIHVEQLTDLLNRQCGREVDLPYGLKGIREYGGICLSKKKEESKAVYYALNTAEYEEMEYGRPLRITMPSGEEFCFRILLVENVKNCENWQDLEKNIPVKPYTKWFDYDKIKDNIVIRNRRSGDYMTINSQCQHKALKSVFINDKVPGYQRDSLLLLADADHIIWVVDGRISSYYKVNANTKRILEVIYKGGVPNG